MYPSRVTSAACGPADADLFFGPGPDLDCRQPRETHAARAARVAAALAICGRCPVRDPCRQWADEHQVLHGVWGGEDRDRPARARPPAAELEPADHGRN